MQEIHRFLQKHPQRQKVSEFTQFSFHSIFFPIQFQILALNCFNNFCFVSLKIKQILASTTAVVQPWLVALHWRTAHRNDAVNAGFVPEILPIHICHGGEVQWWQFDDQINSSDQCVHYSKVVSTTEISRWVSFIFCGNFFEFFSKILSKKLPPVKISSDDWANGPVIILVPRTNSKNKRSVRKWKYTVFAKKTSFRENDFFYPEICNPGLWGSSDLAKSLNSTGWGGWELTLEN